MSSHGIGRCWWRGSSWWTLEAFQPQVLELPLLRQPGLPDPFLQLLRPGAGRSFHRSTEEVFSLFRLGIPSVSMEDSPHQVRSGSRTPRTWCPGPGTAFLAGRRHRARVKSVPNSEWCLVYILVPNFKKSHSSTCRGTCVTLTQPEWHSPPGAGRQVKVSGKAEVQATCSPHLAPPRPIRPHWFQPKQAPCLLRSSIAFKREGSPRSSRPILEFRSKVAMKALGRG